MRRLAPVLLFAALAVWLLSPSILGGKVMGGDDQLLFDIPFNGSRPAEIGRPSNTFLFDASYVFHPDQQFVRSELRSGRLPAWTPYQSGGRPLLAAQQSAPLFPLNAISYVLPYWRSLAFIAAIKLIVAALGAFLLCRALALDRGPAMLAGVAYAFSAYLVSWLSHPHDNLYALLPLLLLTIDRAAGRGRAVDALGLGAVTGLCLLGGHPESMVVLAPALVPWAAFRLWTHRPAGASARQLGRRVVPVAGGALLGAVIGAVMVLPLLEALSQSYATARGQTGLPRPALISFAFPEFWGRPDHVDLGGGPANYAERTAYVGVIPMLLAAGGLVARRPRPAQVFFAAVVVLGFLLAFDAGPVTAWLVDLPGLRLANMTRFLVVIAMALAVLGAYGLQAALDGDRAARLRMIAGAAVAAIVPAGAWLVRHLSPLPPQKEALRYLPNLSDTGVTTPDALQLATVVRWSVLAGLLLALLALVVLRPRAARWLAPVCVVVAALDVVSLGRGYQTSIDLSSAQPPTPASVRQMQRTIGDQRMGVDAGGFGPNLPSRYGLKDVRGHELPVVERQEKLFAALGGGGFQRAAIGVASPRTARLLDVFAVRQVMAPNTVSTPDRSLRPVYRDPLLTVFENRDAFPRAWVAYGSRSARGQADARSQVVGSSTRRLRDAPVIEGGDPAASAPRGRSSPARVTSENPGTVRLDVRARRAGWLILDDTYYPGWHATVDGQRAAIKPANAAFRAVRVPAGRHRVAFEYRSGMLRAGWMLSLLGVLVLVGGSALAVARGRRRSRA